MKRMYVLTYLNVDGMRTFRRNQGRDFFDTRAEAQTFLEAVTANNSRDNLAACYGPQALDTFQVRWVECYDNGDATGVWFDTPHSNNENR